MIALDTNVLVNLLVQSQPDHEATKKWLLGLSQPLATTNTNVAELLRLVTHPRLFPAPLTLHEAIDVISHFIQGFDVEILEDPEAWWLTLKELTADLPTLRGNEVFDARIALCLRYHGVRELATLDDDFRKYRFLKVVTPKN